MKKYPKYLIIIVTVVVISINGCTAKPSEVTVLSNRISEIEEINNRKSEEIIKRLESIEYRISEVEKTINIKNKNEEDLPQDAIDELMSTIEDVELNINFIESMIWGRSLFDLNKIKVGDNVNEMIVTDITSRKGMQIQFSGQKQLTGNYSIIKDDYYLGNIVTFSIDDKLSDILPRAKDDMRTLWFRFSNYDEAVDMLEEYGDSGEITIIIDEYYIDLLESDVINEAKLIKVVSK
ncbi:hypothetical protein AN1V17_16230 [Vallitalea sediminicola]